MEEEEKEIIEEKKNTSPSMIVIVVSALLLICTAIGVLIGMKLSAPANNNNYNSKNQESELDNGEKTERELNDEEKLESGSDNVEETIELTAEDLKKYKEIISFFNKNFSTNYPLKIENITNQEILHSAMGEVWLEKQKDPEFSVIDSEFSAIDLHNMITKMYGADSIYSDEDILCQMNDGVLYKYNNNGKYQFYDVHGHDGCQVISENYIQEAKTANNILEIKTKNIYAGMVCGSYGRGSFFYKDALKQQLLYDQSDHDVEDYISFDEIYELKKDEIPITTYIFQKDIEGNYSLKEITVE